VRGKAGATLILEQAILEIVEERAPITVRGICYALFVRNLIPSMEVGQTQRISRITTAMREDETLDWTKIVDDSRRVERARTWANPDSIIKVAVKTYRRNNWQDQPTIVEVWSEKGTVQGVLAPVLDDLGVAFRVMKGFGSFTRVMEAATDSNADFDRNQNTVALYVGDWDPSGMCMSEKDLPERPDTRRLPHFDVATKQGDSRHDWFVERYGRRCWELDAMDPNALRNRVRKAIESYIDRTLWSRAIEIEEAEVESMKNFHTAWQSVARNSP
jgi:hypothetical protein